MQDNNKTKQSSKDPLRVWEDHICFLIDKGILHYSKDVIRRRTNKKR